MGNTARQNGRRKAGKDDPYLADLRVHDLRHTVGMRLEKPMFARTPLRKSSAMSTGA